MSFPKRQSTSRLDIALRACGQADMPAILFVHGNLSSSVFWEDVMTAMQPDYYAVAPDLRGFGATQALPIDARSGLDDMALDLLSLVHDLDWNGFTSSATAWAAAWR